MPRLARAAALLAVCLSAACAEPPSKEMNQAQGAIDAARAAGADQYAAAEFNAATEALKRSEAAVTQRDYRLALNHALDSRERAQEAARQAVERRAQARGEAERAVAALDALVTRAVARLKDPEVTRLPRRAIQEPVRTIDTSARALQEARAALAANDYTKATTTTDGLPARLDAALAAIDAAVATRSAGRKR